MLSEVIAEVAEHGHANVSDPYGGPYLARIWEDDGKLKMVRMANHQNVMLVVCDSWDDLAWHFQAEPTIYPHARLFPFHIGEKP
jgi:hypothetical protein